METATTEVVSQPGAEPLITPNPEVPAEARGQEYYNNDTKEEE
jgi:hypothetical protein